MADLPPLGNIKVVAVKFLRERPFTHEDNFLVIYVYNLQYCLLLKHCIFITAIKITISCQIIVLGTSKTMVLY